jgi:hypothetical protein
MESINITRETKYQFEVDRANAKVKNNREISQDEFVKMLIKNWRKK